jgi:hypothetical protein
MHRSQFVALILSSIVLATACGGDNNSSAPKRGATSTSSTASTKALAAAVIDPGDGGRYRAAIDPADFVVTVDNPYLPLPPGARWHYRGDADGEPQTTDVVVTGAHKQIMGVATTAVRDTVRNADGTLVEDTIDWFAQDRAGNVWYFGEDTKEYENGKVTSTAGAWTAGLSGAQPGIVMPAQPEVGRAYRQEFDPGNAEDLAQVARVGAHVTVEFGSFADVLVTKEWTPLEPKVVEEKYYARGVGMVLETTVQGGHDRSQLTTMSR